MNDKIKYIYITHFKYPSQLMFLPIWFEDTKNVGINFGTTKSYDNLEQAANIISSHRANNE